MKRTVCVNALHRASFISTLSRDMGKNKHEVCQCSSSGFCHFYEFNTNVQINTLNVSMPFIGRLLYSVYYFFTLLKSLF